MGQDRKKIIAIDFDGVIHNYSRGWQGGDIYDPVTVGFFDWAARMRAHGGFELAVFSSRSGDAEARRVMRSYMEKSLFLWRDSHAPALAPELYLEDFSFPEVKPPAWVSIDDRGIQFNGDWEDAGLQPETLADFKPWTQGIT